MSVPESPAARARPHALSIRGLNKRYGTVAAIDDVTIDIASGEFLSLLGPSGSGKSSILMAVAGFVTPDRGEILLDGEPITHRPPEQRNFGLVFQGYALFPHMSVRGNIAYPLKLRGISGAELDQRVRQALDLVHLTELADRLPRQLSGGQQQRVALARALIFEPAVVLLDEPLSALDKKLRAELQFELKALHARLGMTFVNVTHDQEEAMTMSDRIVILRDGRIQQIGGPQELYNRPASRFVADFLGRANFLEGTVAATDGSQFELHIGKHPVRHRGDKPAITVGTKALLAVRPERMRLAATGSSPNGLNRMDGEIVSAAFVGAQHFYVLDTAAGRVAVTVPAFGSGALRAPADRVAIEWPVDAGVIVEDR
jgi:spermidine/putrescine ABC transporter ATP-binding subunit